MLAINFDKLEFQYMHNKIYIIFNLPDSFIKI